MKYVHNLYTIGVQLFDWKDEKQFTIMKLTKTETAVVSICCLHKLIMTSCIIEIIS